MQEYDSTDILLHQMAQLIAQANRSYVPSQPDDSHTNMSYDHENARLCGRWMRGELGEIMPAIDLNRWTYDWLNEDGKVVQSHQMLGMTFTQLNEEIDRELHEIGLPKSNFKEQLHFKIPEYKWLVQPFEQASQKGVEHWMRYRQLGNQACQYFIDQLNSSEEFRIWPHHFDTGTYVSVNEQIGLGFGLAMKDSILGQAYFYLSGYGRDGSSINIQDFSALANGKWIEETSWRGAVLGLSEIEEKDADQALQIVTQFIDESLWNYLKK